jgi:hypothetical protein
MKVRSRKKSDIRNRRLSRFGGPLMVTDVRLIALTKIRLASGVFWGY